MDANPHAAGDQPDDEVFGPVEDGEEVFEWIDDSDTEDDPEARADQAPPPTFRERLTALRAGVQSLRSSPRTITAVAVSLILACALGGGATAWFDGVAGAADRAGVVALAVDSVVDGDPAAAKYDSAETSATGEYVVELANNSPDAITVAAVGFDAGTLMSSTAWKPVGSPRIPGGATGKVTLTVKMFCPMVVMGVQTGNFGVNPSDGTGASSMPFPALQVKVRDGNGDERDLVLPTRATVSGQARSEGTGLFRAVGGASTPQIVTADAGACRQWATDRLRQLIQPNRALNPAQLDGVAFSYDKVTTEARRGASSTFALGINVHNTTDHKLTVHTRPDLTAGGDSTLKVEWLPAQMDLAPGQTAEAHLTATFSDCSASLIGAQILSMTMLDVENPDTGDSLPVFPDQAITGSLHLTNDVARQMKAAC